MTHVRTSPYYPQSNGKIERWHKSLKGECIRPGTPLSLDDARRLVEGYVEHYNNVRLNSAIGYITPKDMLAGRQQEIHAERDRKLEEARKQRQIRRQQAAYKELRGPICRQPTIEKVAAVESCGFVNTSRFCAFYLQKRPTSGFAVRPIQNAGAALLTLSAPSYGLKLRDQPRLSHPPVAFGGVYRNIEDRGRFFDAQSAEVTKFHYAAFAGVDFCQFVERAVERQQLDSTFLGRQQHIIEGDSQGFSATLGKAASSGVIHQDAADDLGAQGQEMRPVFALDSTGTHQFEIGLIRQGSRFQAVPGRRPARYWRATRRSSGYTISIKRSSACPSPPFQAASIAVMSCPSGLVTPENFNTNGAGVNQFFPGSRNYMQEARNAMKLHRLIGMIAAAVPLGALAAVALVVPLGRIEGTHRHETDSFIS